MPRAAADLGAARLLRSADFVAGPDRAHGPLALPDETRPPVRAHNAELPHLLVLRARTAHAAAVTRQRPSRYAQSACGYGSTARSVHRGTPLAGWRSGPDSRPTRSVARLIPVDMLMLCRLPPIAISASTLRRTSLLYIAVLWQRSLTKGKCAKTVFSRCPGWDSNPHYMLFESIDSAVGLPGHHSSWRERPDHNLLDHGTLMG